MKEFRKAIKANNEAERPILLIVWPEHFMSNMVSDFSKVLRNYNDVFDIFYCKDENKAAEFFDVKKMPKEVPHLYIIDPKRKKPIKTRLGNSDPNKFHLEKFEGYIFQLQDPSKELNDFIEKFLDEKLEHVYNSLEREQATAVKWVNSENFETEIVNNNDVN